MTTYPRAFSAWPIHPGERLERQKKVVLERVPLQDVVVPGGQNKFKSLLAPLLLNAASLLICFRTVSLILTRNPNVILRSADNMYQLIIMQLRKDFNFSLFQKYGMIMIKHKPDSNVELKFFKAALFLFLCHLLVFNLSTDWRKNKDYYYYY